MPLFTDRFSLLPPLCFAVVLVLSGCDGGTSTSTQPQLCSETCEFAGDGDCDDGGPGSLTSACELGTDCADCSSRIDADQIGSDLADETVQQMPTVGAKVSGVLSAASGSPGSLFGLTLDDGTIAYMQGEVIDSDVTLNGVVIADDAGKLIYKQTVSETGMTLTMSTGDSFEFIDKGTTGQFIFTFKATMPASVVVVDIDAEGLATVNEALTRLEETPNPSYDDGNSTINLATLVSKRAFDLQGRNFEVPFFFDQPCSQQIDDVIKAANFVCDAKKFLVGKLPELVIQRGCVALNKTLDAGRGDQSDSSRFKVFTGFKIGFGLVCNVLEGAVKVNQVAQRVTPFDAVCTVIELGDDLLQVATERSTGTLVCDALSGGDPSAQEPDTTGGDDQTSDTTTDESTEGSGSSGSCIPDTINFDVISYINRDKSTGTEPAQAAIKLTGLSSGNPVYCFSSLSGVTSLTVQEALTGTVVYGVTAFDFNIEGGGSGVITGPITHGDTTIAGLIVNPLANPPLTLRADGTQYSVWVLLRDDADGDGFLDSSWLTFQLPFLPPARVQP